MIVAEYQVGKSHVLIDDTFQAKTPEEQSKVNHDFAMACWPIIEKLLAKGPLPDRYLIKMEMKKETA